MNAWVWRRITFDAAHSLLFYNGPCRNVHGHTYTVELGLYGKINNDGMVVDMRDMGNFLEKKVCTALDHTLINGKLGRGRASTAENIARWILERAKHYFNCGAVTKFTVRVWETPTSWVEITA